MKERSVWLVVDHSSSVCSCRLPDSSGQAKEMAKIRLLSSAIVIDVFDSRNIQDRSLLKVYNKDPAHAFNHAPKTVNGDMRVSFLILFLILFSRSNQPTHSLAWSPGGNHTPPPDSKGSQHSPCLMTHYLLLGKEIRFPGHSGAMGLIEGLTHPHSSLSVEFSCVLTSGGSWESLPESTCGLYTINLFRGSLALFPTMKTNKTTTKNPMYNFM